MAKGPAAEEKKAPKKPTHEAFFIEDHGPGKKGFWQKIGAGWENRDGSINVVFSLMPVKPGTIQIRQYEEKEKDKK